MKKQIEDFAITYILFFIYAWADMKVINYKTFINVFILALIPIIIGKILAISDGKKNAKKNQNEK